MDKVYCKNCLRWYSTKVDQCNIPDCGMFNNLELYKASGENLDNTDFKGQNFIKSHLKSFSGSIKGAKKIYGHPSLLNKDNDCYFYKTLPRFLKWLVPTLRYFN